MGARTDAIMNDYNRRRAPLELSESLDKSVQQNESLHALLGEALPFVRRAGNHSLAERIAKALGI